MIGYSNWFWAVLHESDKDMERDKARMNMRRVVNLEFSEMADALQKKEVFREAAAEMTRTLNDRLSVDMLSDMRDVKVRQHFYSLFKTAVPEDVLTTAKSAASYKFNSFANHGVQLINHDQSLAAAAGLQDAIGRNYVTPGSGIRFMDGLDDSMIAAIAKLGVVNHVHKVVREKYNADNTVNEGVPPLQLQTIKAADARLKEAANTAFDELRAQCESKVVQYSESKRVRAPQYSL